TPGETYMRNYPCTLMAGMLVVGILATLTPASASIVIVTDRAEFEALTPGAFETDLSDLGLASGAWQNYSTSAGLTLPDGTHLVGWRGNNVYQLRILNPLPGAEESFGTGTMIAGPDYKL